MRHYQNYIPLDDSRKWHDEAAQQEALEALEAGNLEELKRVFHEARGLSLERILREIIKERL